MKQKNFLKNTLIFLLMFSISSISAQIYNADFSNDGDGFADHTTSSPPADAPASVGPFGSAGNQWSLSYTSKPGSDGSANSFKVVDGALFSDDWGGQGIFQSQSIDITSINTINISAITQNTGANDDSFVYFYILDGGSRIETDMGATSSGDALNYSINNLDVSGASSLIVGFEFSENGGSQGYTTSSFTVSESIVTPTITFDSATSTETETDATFTSANIPISVTNYDGNQIDIDVTITGGTAEAGDYSFTTQSLSFTSNSTQNITVDINDDADYEDETIILTISETSSVSGLVISQATHTLTITDDDTAPTPSLIITEIADTGDNDNARFVEIYNNGSTTIDFSTTPIYISRFTNGNGTATESNVEKLTTGTLNAGDYLIIAASGTNFTAAYGFSADEINGGFGVNGDDPFGMYSGIYPNGTLFDVYGEIGVDGTGQNWEYEDSRAIRNNIMDSPSTTWQNSSWTISAANVADATPGASENEFRYDGDWKPRDISNATSSDNIYVTSNVTLTSDLSINNFNVTSGSVVTVSGTSLIVNGTSTGTVTYNRSLATDNWYLMSSPVTGETYDSSWVADNNIDDTSSSNGNIGIATYTPADDTWSYLQSGGSGSFTNGKGFSIKQDVLGTISFTGTLNTSDVSTAVVTGGNGGFNLIGNPFTTNLSSAQFLTGNTANLTSETIWVWNQATNSYDAYVTGESFILAPTQGFFVSASSATNLTIAESYQTSTTGTFQKSANTKIELFVTDGTNNRFVKIYYNPTATKNFDNGFDGETFGGIKDSFELYTNLISNNIGKKYQVQSLPNSDLETMIIPVGVKVEANKEITFTAKALNLPTNIKVYLEDKVTNTFTRLDEENSKYTFTSDVALDGVGRFYLHTKSSALSIETLDLDNVSIFKTNNSNLRITGLSTGKASVKLYNIIGKEVITKAFNASTVNDIAIPTLAKGIYIVQLETEEGRLNKKITLE